jgi:putative glutamine amidotransferase
VNHEAGRKVAVAHAVEVSNDSLLAEVVCGDSRRRLSGRAKLGRAGSGQDSFILPVNSSHHQSAAAVGEGLRIVARCPDDGIIEALEGTSSDHFVLAVQWHPERSIAENDHSRAIFNALTRAARKRLF